jgi:signal transduction histidine kinase
MKEYEVLNERFQNACLEKDTIETLADEMIYALGEALEVHHVLLFYQLPGTLQLVPVSQWRWDGEDLPDLPCDHPLVITHKVHHELFELKGKGEELAKQALLEWRGELSVGLYVENSLAGILVFGLQPAQHLGYKEKHQIRKWAEKMSLAFEVFGQIQEYREFQSTLALKSKIDQLEMLSASLHHDVLNPLNTISLECQWFEKKHLLNDSGENLAVPSEALGDLVLKHANRITAVTRRLGQFVRQNRGQLKIEGLSLSAMLTHCIEMIGKDQFAADNVAVELELENPFVEIYGDGVLLEQVILSLLMRSYQSIGKQGKIRVVSYEPDAFTVVLVVNDTGSQEVLPSERESTVTGSGGEVEISPFSLIKKYVEMMRGMLECRSPLTGGNQYILTLVKKWEKKNG